MTTDAVQVDMAFIMIPADCDSTTTHQTAFEVDQSLGSEAAGKVQ